MRSSMNLSRRPANELHRFSRTHLTAEFAESWILWLVSLAIARKMASVIPSAGFAPFPTGGAVGCLAVPLWLALFAGGAVVSMAHRPIDGIRLRRGNGRRFSPDCR